MDNRPISELDSAISVNDEDILLISQKENNEYVSRKIGAGVFRGDSAYDLAVKEGFKGDLNAWLSSIKGWQPITSGEFVGLLDSELDKSKLYKDLNNRLNASTTSLKEDIAKQLNDVNNLRQQVIAEADKRIQEIHNLNTGLIEEANKRIQDIKLVQESITLETSERLEQAVELANQILLEKDSRTDDIKNLIEKLNSEQSDRVAAVQQVIDLLSSEIETRRSLLSETVQKINKETSDRVKEIEAVRNSITQEQLTRVSELEDIMKDIDAVDAKVGTNHSFLLNNYSTTKTASEETAKQIEALRTTYIDPKLEQKASTTALEQITTEVGTINDALQANITKTDGVFAKVNPSMAGTESGYIGDESKYVGVWTEQSARIEEDFALGKRVDNVVATYTSNKETTDARIAREEKARADGDSALASVVTSLTTRVGQSEGKLVTLEQVNTDLDSSLSQISTKLDNTIQEVSTKASSSALDELASNVEVLEGSVSSTTNSITALENSLETTNTNLNKKADSAAVNGLSSKVTAIDETVNSNSSNIIALTNSLGSKNKTYYQPLVPTENVSVGDIWVNSTPSRNNELKRYNGLYWDVISDPRVSSNSSAISALESKTTQHDEELTSQSSLITDLKADLDVSKQDLLLKADSSALNDLSNTVSSIGGNISSVSGDVTELKNNLETLETNIQTKASATALEDLSTKVERTNNSVVSQGQDITNLNNSLVTVNTNINSKGKVIYSENEPSEVERLAQNLWIDTKDGNNTPKRWDGFKWEIVSDKVATEALAKAEANSEVLTTKADASAVSSLTNKVENVEKTITSQSNDLVVLTNSLEQTSQLAADKGKVIFSNVEPEESERILQNLWIDTSNNNNTPKRWTGTKWSTVTDKVALDALTASQAVSDALTTKADSSAVSSLESKVTDLGESISSQSQDITTLNNSLVLANNTISGKGKIIYSDSAPAEGDRLPQNLWIDTTSGGNIPKRWNGEFWLVITDKTALDALAAANQVKEDLADKVDSSAFNSLTSRVNSSERAITSQSDSITKLNNDLTVTDQIAREALSDSKDLKEQITTKASTEALENLTSSVISIDGKVTTNTQKVLELTGTVEAIGENLSTKADASVLTDYSTKIDTNEAISKANTTLTSSYTKAVEDVRTETNTKLDDQLLITKASTSGKLLYADATFLKGFNSVSAYDNNSTNKVVVDRITREIDNPTKSSHQLKITIANGATPGYGGFYQLIPSRANAVFVIKYLMKVPNTYTVIPTANALGSGSSDKIIGSAAGTGKYETYVRVIRCGDSGSFSTGGHIYFYGTSLPKDSTDAVMLASIECWDATDFVKSATSDEVATISASLVNDYYTKTDADKAVSNSLTAFQTNYVDKELNKKASANTVDQISNEIHNTETGLDATAKKLSGVYAQVNPEFIGSEKGYIGKNSGSVSVWSEYSARIEGDLALSTRIDSVKADWEGNLASVQTQTKATSDKVSSLASQITVLSSAVEGNISLVMDQYYTKVQTGQVVSQGISDFKANYVAPQLNLKASSQALEQTQSQVTEIDGKLKTTSQRTEGVYAQVNPDLVGSDSGSIGTENQNVGSWSQYSALIEGDFATSQKIDVVSAAVANNTASIKQTNTVVIDKFKSVAESLNRVETKFNDNLSSVNSVIGVWSDKDKSISKYIIDLNSLVGSNQAEITRNYLTSADTTKAITEGIDRFKTEYLSDELKKKASAEVLDQVKSAIENTETGLVATADKLDGVFVKVNPKLIGSDRDFIGSTSSSVGIWTEYSARIEEDFALGNRIDNLYVNLGKNAAAIQTVNNVLVDKTQALAKSITHIDSKFESSVGSINTKLGTWTSSESSISDYITNINSAVGKNSSSIQIQGKSIDGLSSQYTVKLDTNGRVSGFGLASNPTNQATSEFAVVADKFYIASPDTNDKGKNPFYVLTKNQVADGVTIPAGVYIDQTFIRKASIDTTHIKDASIVNAKIFDLDAAKLTTGYISAERIEGESISAKHLQVGSVTEAKFSPSVLNNYLTSNQFVSDSLSDNVLTASEKTSIKNNWEQIKNNLKFYLESAKIFDITIATPAYTDLSAYILTLNLDDTNSTRIDSELFKAKFNAWYAEEYAIRSAIDTKVKDLNKNSLNQATSATDLLNRWKANKNNTLYIDDNRIAVNMIAAENIAADSITADKIKFGGVSSQNLAEDIKSDISKGMTANSKVNELIANLDDDNILTSVEKTFLYSKWQEVEKTGAWIAWQCFNIFGSNLDKETSYDPYFNLFKNFISENVSKDGLNKSTNISTITITVDGATYSGSEAMRRMMVAYYEAENKMLSKIQELQYKYTLGVDTKVSLAASVLDKLADDNIITKQEKPALKLQYTNIINDFDDLALAASNQGISSSVFATAYNDLVNVFNLIFQDMASDTSWPGDDLRAKMRAYSDQRGYLIQRLSNDAKDKANGASAKALEALQALTKMADDNVITIYEKPALSFSWQNIINDFDDLETAGKNQQVDTTAFKTAYTSLKTAVDLILANPAVDTEWSGQDLRDRMKSYADQRGSLLQRLANDAEEKANAAMSAITDAVSDRILTPSEKQQFKIKWVEEYQDFDKLKLKAQEANISSSNGNYSNYVSAFNYINDTFTPVWNSADNSQVDPTEWKTRFETLRKYKTLLENEINSTIKTIASTALANTQQLTETIKTKADSSSLMTLDHDVKVIDGQVKAYGESITSLTADLATKVNNSDINSIVSLAQNGNKQLVSTVGLDDNTYYPMTVYIGGKTAKIAMYVALGQSKASWATHGAGWSGHIEVTQRGGGWGSNPLDLTIEKFDYAWCNQSPIINVGQIGTHNLALFYLRGGTDYYFYLDSNVQGLPELWREKHVFNEQYNVFVEPMAYNAALEPKSLKQNVQANAVATSTLKASVDQIDGKVIAHSESIQNLQTNVTNINKDLVTKANSSVLTKYYTKDEADRATAGKIEDFNSSFEIGGRNYFKKSTQVQPYQLSEFIRDLPDTPNGFYVIGSQTDNNLRFPGVITGNGKWTVSGWVRGSQSTAISFVVDICDRGGSEQIVVNKNGANTWERFVHSVTVDNYSADTYNFLDIRNLSWAYFYFKDIKVEKGSKATDWTPAPEDVDQKFVDINANIKTTYITKSDATQAISSAKTELNSSYNKSLMDSRADGVNLINFSQMVPGYFVGDGSIGQADTDHMDMNYYSCIGDESFTCHMSGVSGSVGGVGRVLWYDSNKNLISSSDCNWNGTYTPYTFKSPANARFYRYSMIGKYPVARIKLERGTISTGFSFSEIDDTYYRVLLSQALSGNQLVSSPDFRNNIDGISPYDNTGSGKVFLQRVVKEEDNPSNSTHQMNCTIANGAVPGYGGFVFSVQSKYNGLFAIKTVMKIPVGYIFNIASNQLPDGTDYRIIGSNEGTGKYETYTVLCKCGDTGIRHNFGHIWFTDRSEVKLGASQSDIIKVSKLEVFDATSDKPLVTKASFDEYKQTVSDANGAISESVSRLSTRVDGNEAAIKVQAQSINGINAQYTIKTDVNGKVAGIGLVNSGKSSEFAVTADTFRVSNGSTDIAPFSISDNTVVFNGKVNFTNITNRAWKLTLVGTSLALTSGEWKSITYIDDSIHTEDAGESGSRGIRVTIYDTNKNVIFNNVYDTYTAPGCSQFKNDVFSLNLDRLIVTIRSMDATQPNNQDFIDGMNKLGFDGNTINSSLIYNARTSFCGISQYIESGNIRNNILVINGDEQGKQKKAVVTASIKDGKLIPDSYSSNTGVHKLNEAANIAINNLGPSVNNLNNLVGSEDKVKGIVRSTTEISGGNIITGSITADKLAIGTPNNLVSNFSKTNSGTGWSNYTGLGIATLFDGTNTPCMLVHTAGSVQVQSDRFKVDPAKSYEFTVWLWSEGGNTAGLDYIGINAFDSSGSIVPVSGFDVNNPNSNWDESNPYFWYRGHGENYRNKWVKYTGYVLAAGTDLSSIKGVLGLNVHRCFRLKSNVDSMLFRILNFYNDGTTVNNLYMAHPTVREVDTNSLIETVNNKKATSNLYYPGTTLIDGGKIQTGTITADRIQIGSLSKDRLDSDLKSMVDTSYINSSQALSSANTANTKIDTLEIGNNLWSNKEIYNYYGGGMGFYYPEYVNVTGSTITIRNQPVGGSIPGNKIQIDRNKSIVISWYNVSDHSGNSIWFTFADSSGNIFTSQSVMYADKDSSNRVIFTILSQNIPANASYIILGIGSNGNSNYVIKDVQVEQSTKVTGWSISSKDVQYELSYNYINSMVMKSPDTNLVNKWAFISFKKSTPSTYETLTYSYLKGDITEQGYKEINGTMFSNTKYDNSILFFRTTVNVTSSVSKTITFTGDDAHAILINGVMQYSNTVFATSTVTISLSAGINIIDIIVSNGIGGAGFSMSELPSAWGTMYAPKIVYRELSDLKDSDDIIFSRLSDIVSDSVLTPSEKQQLKITWADYEKQYDHLIWQCSTLGIDGSTTPYYTSYIDRFNYIKNNLKPIWEAANNSNIDKDSFVWQFNDLSSCIHNLLDHIQLKQKTLSQSAQNRADNAYSTAGNVSTAVKNISNWDGVSNTLTISRNNISGGKDLANLWTNQLFDPAFPQFESNSISVWRNAGKGNEHQGSNVIDLMGRHIFGALSTKFYVKPNEQYVISFIGYNYTGVGFYGGLWVTDENGNETDVPAWSAYVPFEIKGEAGGGWKYYECIYTVPSNFNYNIPLIGRVHFFQNTYDYSQVHCKIGNLVVKKVIKESGIDPQLVDRSKQAKQLVDDIVSDNKITPDEKQGLLVTYKQIANDNDIWRNQAALIGLDYSRQYNAYNTLLSGSRPYLGWVCRSDALTQTDTLNAGERTTLMNAISEYHAANQDLAQRVGSNLRTTGQTALNKVTWVSDTRDLNSITETGKYFTRLNTNSPVSGYYGFLEVENFGGSTITQKWWADNTQKFNYIRYFWNGGWTAWERIATGSELTTVNDIAVGASGAAAAAQNRADSAYNSANYLERYNVDLDSYKTTGKYFVRSYIQGEIIPGTDNELKIWMYLVVDGAVPERITQTAWHDQTPDKVWTRVWTGYWQPWKRQTDTQVIKNLITDPNVNTIAAGARDLLNRWKANGNGTLYIDDNSIAVNKIGADQIAAGSITTEKLAVGSSTNLWANPEFKDYGANKTMVNNGYRNAIGGKNGWYVTGNAYGSDDTMFSVCANEEYLFDFIIGYHAGNCNIGFHLYNGSRGWINQIMQPPVNYIDLGSGWYRASVSIKIPGNIGSAYFARVSFWANSDSAVTIADLIVTRKNSGQLIVDGSITGNKITANTEINAPKIKGGEININNNFVVDQWGNLTVTSATSGGKLQITNNLIKVFDANGTLRVKLGVW